jgi:hypothetical protein
VRATPWKPRDRPRAAPVRRRCASARLRTSKSGCRKGFRFSTCGLACPAAAALGRRARRGRTPCMSTRADRAVPRRMDPGRRRAPSHAIRAARRHTADNGSSFSALPPHVLSRHRRHEAALLASLEPLPRRQQSHDRWQRRAALRAAVRRGCHRHLSSVLRHGLSSRGSGQHVSTGGKGSYRETQPFTSICRYTRHMWHAARSSMLRRRQSGYAPCARDMRSRESEQTTRQCSMRKFAEAR